MYSRYFSRQEKSLNVLNFNLNVHGRVGDPVMNVRILVELCCSNSSLRVSLIIRAGDSDQSVISGVTMKTLIIAASLSSLRYIIDQSLMV